MINNKKDSDSNSTAKYWNNTIDDLLYFFRSVAQMTSDGTKQGENVKFEPVPGFFLWSLIMTQLHFLLFHFYVYYLSVRYSVDFKQHSNTHSS